jgi:meso-butanediol dehydrogenase / (S,S)-butanediol dehydrogenase / diacetyl reductase
MLADLSGHTALVTGAGSGIGAGIAAALVAQGAVVAVTDLRLEWAEETAGRIDGAKTMALALDVTDTASVTRAVAEVIDAWAALDILVNNAGITADPTRETAEDSEDDWDRTFAVNVKGAVHCCDAVIPEMRARRYGKIVNIGSMAAHAARGTSGAYAAGKAAVLRYTKGLAVSVAPFNVNVNAVCPGAVWTRFQEGDTAWAQRLDPSLAGRDPRQVFEERFTPLFPLGRPQTPEDVGKITAFLVSDDARNITGQCIHVDGGAILRD